MENYNIGKHVFFNSLKSSIISKNNEVLLGSREAKLLLLFCQKPNEVINKSTMYKFIWGALVVNETSLTKAVSNLRKVLLEFEGVTCKIKTVPREGYIFICENDKAEFKDDEWTNENSFSMDKNDKEHSFYTMSNDRLLKNSIGNRLLIYIAFFSSLFSGVTSFLIINFLY